MLYDDIADREGHWKRVMEYNGIVGHNGVVLNPDNFQFAVEEVAFTSFRIMKTDVKPLPKYIKQLRIFPALATYQTFGLVRIYFTSRSPGRV